MSKPRSGDSVLRFLMRVGNLGRPGEHSYSSSSTGNSELIGSISSEFSIS